MSDLFCPATIIVARHGQATYDNLGVASDDGGWLSDLGRQQAVGLAETLADRRVAAIWCSGMSRAVQTAEIIAGRLGVSVRVRGDLREASVGGFAGQPLEVFDSVYLRWLEGDLASGPPLAETGADVVRRMTAELHSAADQFRGEAMLVVSHGAAMGITLPRLARNVPSDFARGKDIENCTTCELTVDADGWLLKTWAGQPV